MKPELVIIGHVRSTIKTRDDAPKMEDEPGAVRARIELDPAYADGLLAMEPGAQLDLLTWFHQSSRDALQVHPRGNLNSPLRGVFTTRSPNRPNPIGLHQVTVVAVEAPATLVVEPLEAIDGTPVIDIKPRKKERRG
ncbi:tRNA (N6-threonylcarbamoyladenosine(37)-N6)-methyltransferase TrmO [Pseudodesulfovibrio sp.]|uniref:tRNA (N6-threonylcarbamoyladenosine(37)-N6)-methyltransferase TrmO n=1 Tax=Pseudodesulfovibrio sp. TaxID=2035812 RepID=UPI0026032EE9|nr:tRNA (N6-threonylcarbamoyladenosine(37)-N6)-methyltransferase TrmO [Pseudodesulfovibrio sp.]MDD3310869.1 tRNA (N6-threonylcarbamoyladenosine(37)-N6)-methyltransferase TrmO [Pseudodesulfovibrio sp.]